jgi:NAD(P)-dependent dehydrogenase (short-subunit alcohol dehydrogenase family)
VAKSDRRPLPGSLATTAADIAAAGRRALPIAADLLDRSEMGAAVATVLERWGHIDVLLNNGRYIGPGHMDRLLDTPLELLDRHLDANVMAPLACIKLALPSMLERGAGVIINVTSDVAWSDPPAAAGAGGWGLGYAISKGALHRVAGVLAHEVAGTGVSIVNLSPGFVATERIAIDMAEFGFDASQGAPPSVIGDAVAWLVTSGDALGWNGKTFVAQEHAPH